MRNKVLAVIIPTNNQNSFKMCSFILMAFYVTHSQNKNLGSRLRREKFEKKIKKKRWSAAEYLEKVFSMFMVAANSAFGIFRVFPRSV